MKNRTLGILLLILIAQSALSNFLLFRIYSRSAAPGPSELTAAEAPFFTAAEPAPAGSIPEFPASLVAYWDFNSSGDTLADRTGNGHHGIIRGGKPSEGIRGGAMDFDGTGYVRIAGHPDLDLMTAMTIIAWIKPSTLDDLLLTVLSRTEGSMAGYDLGIHAYERLFSRLDGGGMGRILMMNGGIKTGSWQQVAVTFNGSAGKLFFNGHLVQEKRMSGNRISTLSDLYIGSPADRKGGFFKGGLDEIKIFKTCLSESEIAAEFKAVSGEFPPEPETAAEAVEDTSGPAPVPDVPVSREGLAAWFPFSGNADDASGNRNHADIRGPVPSSDRFGRPVGAYRFDGIDDVIIRRAPVLLPGGLADRTICGWFRSPKPKQYLAALFGFGAPSDGRNFQAAVGPEDQKGPPVVWRVNGWGDSFDWRTSAAPEKVFDGKWHHCAVTYNAETTVFYLDGKAVDETGEFTFETTPEYIAIGADIDGRGRHFTGDIDDVMIFNRVLSEEEIGTLAKN